jgi:hypothetical protein
MWGIRCITRLSWSQTARNPQLPAVMLQVCRFYSCVPGFLATAKLVRNRDLESRLQEFEVASKTSSSINSGKNLGSSRVLYSLTQCDH